MSIKLPRGRVFPILGYSTPSIIYLLGILCFLSDAGRFESFPLDDAWIHRVYARSFAAGHGFAYNAGVQEAGATSPLWVIVSSPAHWFEPMGVRTVVFAVKGIGILFGMISILLFQLVIRHLVKSPIVALVAAALLALEPRLLFSSLSGMETTLLIALWIGGLYAFLKRRWLLFLILFGLVPVTRPEGLVLLPICVIVFLLANTDYPVWKKVLSSSLLGIPFFLWMLFCRHTTAHWLPNTYYLKTRPFELTSATVADAWQIISSQGFTSQFIFLIGFTVFAVYLIKRRHVSALLFMTVASLVYLVGVIGTRQVSPNGYYWTRWVDPASLFLTATFAAGYSLVLTGKVSLPKLGKSHARPARVIIMAIGAVLLVACIPGLAESFGDRRSHLITDSRAIYSINVEAGLWIKEHTPPGAVVGVNDAGAIRYFGDRYTIDLVGLNYKDAAFDRVSLPELLTRCDWLAIFPSWLVHQRALIEREFDPVTAFSVPVEEYTICDCPGQTIKAIFKKKAAGKADRRAQ